MEICYELYSPCIQKIEVLKLEKRLDDSLMYLRDALPDYSTVDPDMKPVHVSPTGEVPVNEVRRLQGGEIPESTACDLCGPCPNHFLPFPRSK